MALAFDNSSLFYGTSSPMTIAHTCAGTNRVLIVGIGYDDSGQVAVASSVTYAGISLTKIGATAFQFNKKSEIWYLKDPPTGANNIVATITNNSANMWVSGLSYTGGKVANSILDRNSLTIGTAATATTTITPVFDNAWIVGFITEDNITSPATHTGTTQRVADTSSDTFGVCFLGGDTNGPIHPPATTTFGWDLTNTGNWAIAAVAILPDISSGRIIVNKLRPRAFAPGIAR